MISLPKNEMRLLTSCDSKPMEACFKPVKNGKVLAAVLCIFIYLFL